MNSEVVRKLRELADALEQAGQQAPPLAYPISPQFDDGMCDACRPTGICNCVRPGREAYTFAPKQFDLPLSVLEGYDPVQ